MAAPPSQVAAVELIRSLSYRGFGGAEAGNIVALAFGLRPIDGGWSGREIDHLRFVREVSRAHAREHAKGGISSGGLVA
jgi:hypothetical protein